MAVNIPAKYLYNIHYFEKFIEMEKIDLFASSIMRTKRIEKEWSQQELEDYLNVSKAFITDIESPTRKAKLNVKHINELAKIFPCSPQDFLPEQPL
jgi:transcriptional regulator with XRE-family HTH domain